MASHSTLPPSAAELSRLQQAFSKDPTSQAYFPLAEAYLALGKYMEAMVVCKKGAKAFPAKAGPHILMSRIYAAQRKEAKALDEAKLAVELEEGNESALLHLSEMLFESGDTEGARGMLLKAASAAPESDAVQSACQKYGVELPQKEPPQAQPALSPVPAQPQSLAPAPAALSLPSQVPAAVSPAPISSQPTPAPFASAVSAAPQAAILVPAPQPEFPTPAQVGAQAAAQNPASPASRPPFDSHAEEVRRRYAEMVAKYGDPDDELSGAELKAKSLSHVLILGLVLVLIVGGLSGFFYYKKAKAARETEIATLLKKMQEEISHDNYASYQRACEMGEKITTELAPDLFSAHSFLAYAYAIRWGEHGEGDRAKEAAETHLEKAKGSGMEHSYLSAADAYITFFRGEPDAAIQNLEAKISEPDSKGKNSTLLISTLGILQTHAGNLESAIGYLKRAQQAAPADPRISAWTGNALRRQGGNDILAANAYEQALRYEKNHAEAQLGVALMAVDADKPTAAERYINLLLKAEPPPSNRQIALARLAHAIILDGKGKKAEADEEEQRALVSDPNNGELYMMKAERQKRNGDMNGAVASMKEAISKDKNRISFQISLAELLLSESQKERNKDKRDEATRSARDSLKKLAEKSPNAIKLLILLGKAHMYLGDYGDAESTFKKAFSLATKQVEKSEIYLEQGNLAVFQGKSEDAHKAYAEAVKSAGTARSKALALLRDGHLYAKDGDPKKAIEVYGETQGLDETFPDPYFFAGRLLAFNKEVKNQDIAKDQLNEYLTKAPNGPFADQAKKILDRLK